MKFPPSTWRLLKTPPARGAWNMAADEAILEAVGRGDGLPTLRLYAWQPPCLSLGYAQPFGDVDQERTAERGWEVVRRPTGGRAILHTDELTYAVIGPPEEPRLAGGVLESYRRLSRALVGAVERLHVRVAAGEKSEETNQNDPGPVCFEVPSRYEITVDGRKLIGSAQARRKDGVLQHGTLPLHGDLRRITQALAFLDEESRREAAARLAARASTVEGALGRRIGWEQAAQAFEEAFAEILNLQLAAGELTPGELKRAEELVRDKYDHPRWTQRC